MANHDFKLLTHREWMLLNSFLVDIGQLTSVDEFCSKFLQMLKGIIPFDNGHFIFFDKGNSIEPLSYRMNICEKSFIEYRQYYNKIDDFFAKSFNSYGPKKSTDVMDYRKWENTEYFTDFQKKYFFYYICILDIHYNEKLLSSLSLVRDRRSIDFSDRELLYLKLTEPHVANHLYKLVILKNVREKQLTKVIENSGAFYRLSDREIDIIHCVMKGYNNAQIADSLFISIDTVKKHLNNAYRKCNAKNRTELLAKLLKI